MINYGVYSGKVATDLTYGKTKVGKSYAFIRLSCPKSYLGEETKNVCTLVSFSAFGKIADYLYENSKKGDYAEVMYHAETDSKFKIQLIIDKVKVHPAIQVEPLNKLGGEDFQDLDDLEGE